MSSPAVYETETPAEHTARAINSDLQFVVDRLPTEVKEAPVGKVFDLCFVKDIGRLTASYGGARLDKTGRAIMQYIVQLGVEAEGYDGRLRFIKEFALTYQTLHREGPVDDPEPIRAEDLAGCPAPLEVLESTVHIVCEEFARQRSETLEHTEAVIQLDIHRVA